MPSEQVWELSLTIFRPLIAISIYTFVKRLIFMLYNCFVCHNVQLCRAE
ncbi:hypothetical protein QO001_006253 [Methylobacterium brachiatum]|uniref:Uncharacterized protein n=1 Tax=Methylobacterium brachiatum TaxID=269660 RepID=A0AAJ1TZB0_9HYPH|nr:hypothetical protein [Methylobacterium brachiatum]SFV12360.1 hypothetical protein SAMN02799643_05684 [Methylobacterium sp. UNCCL125]